MVPEKDFKPDLHHKTKVWVYLPEGRYFYIHEGHIGVWYQMYALYRDYPSERAAVEAALAHVLYPNVYGLAKYKSLRVRERVFTPNLASVREAQRELRKPLLSYFLTKDQLKKWRAHQAAQHVPPGGTSGHLTAEQKKLKKAHGDPQKFALGVYQCVPGDISCDEADKAIENYTKKWQKAGRS